MELVGSRFRLEADDAHGAAEFGFHSSRFDRELADGVDWHRTDGRALRLVIVGSRGHANSIHENVPSRLLAAADAKPADSLGFRSNHRQVEHVANPARDDQRKILNQFIRDVSADAGAFRLDGNGRGGHLHGLRHRSDFQRNIQSQGCPGA